MADYKLKNEYPELQEKVVLNVDDNEMNQLVISKILDNAGMKTIQAYNGAVAIEELDKVVKPDVILLDLNMPVMGGIETAEYIRSKADLQIPIIINSGGVTAYEKWRLKRLGITEFLEKPYTMKDIFSKLLKHLAFVTA
ncbi:MAG TPA: response regulator [Segetibacter sp.]|jgi:CheY-like chemotaxis protein